MAICCTVPSQLTQRQERGVSVTVLKTLEDEGMNRDTARLDVTTQPFHAATIGRLNAVQTHIHCSQPVTTLSLYTYWETVETDPVRT